MLVRFEQCILVFFILTSTGYYGDPAASLSKNVSRFMSYLILHVLPSPLQKELLNKDNGLTEDLLIGCKVVLKERSAVQSLMSKCTNISSKMVKQVTQIMTKGVGRKQPSILNSQ